MENKTTEAMLRKSKKKKKNLHHNFYSQIDPYGNVQNKNHYIFNPINFRQLLQGTLNVQYLEFKTMVIVIKVAYLCWSDDGYQSPNWK